MIFADERAKDNCWNLYDSYGEICVHCGCCSKDPRVRYKARVDCVTEWVNEQEQFNAWDDDPEFRRRQRWNHAKTVERLKRQLRYYSKKLMEVANGTGEVSAQYEIESGTAANS